MSNLVMAGLPDDALGVRGYAFCVHSTWYAYADRDSMAELLLLVATGNEPFYFLK